MNKSKMSDIVNIISGGTPKTTVSEYWNGTINWLSIVDFVNKNKYVYSSEKYITNEGLKNSSTNLLKKNDIIISARGTVGAMAMLFKPMTFNQSCFGLRSNSDILNQDFLFYYLRNYIKYLKVKTQGSVFQTINLATFDNIDIYYPSIDIQKKISKVLSSIDNKIELNNKINNELEDMAKTIYDYWFLQFEFSNEEGKPYKSSGGKMVWNEELKREIPEGWEVNNILNVCDVVDCLHSKKPTYCKEYEDYYLLTLENLTEKGYIDLSKKYYISKTDYEIWTSRILVKENDFVVTNAGRAGDIGKIPYGVKCAIGRNLTAIRPKNINPYYLRQFFKSNYLKEQVLSNLDCGSFFMSFNVKSIKSLNVLIPNEDIMKKSIDILKPIILKIENNIVENQELTSLRDFLLPLLMNGQVGFKEDKAEG